MDLPDVHLIVAGLKDELAGHRAAGRADRVKEVLAQLKAYGSDETEKAVAAEPKAEKATR